MADRDNDVTITANGFRVVSAGRRADGSVLPDEAIEKGLEEAEFETLRSIALEPEAATRRDAENSEVTIDVTVEPGKTSILLVEDESGLLVWQMPDDAGPSRPSGRRAYDEPEIQRFTIGGGRSAQPGERRGIASDWLAEKITRPIRVHVLRFLARRSIDVAVAKIEGSMPCGPVLVDSDDPTEWRVSDVASIKSKIDRNRPNRILLLVHGTFSSTANSFAGLAASRHFQEYDLVLGYDHRTLGEEPAGNAESMLAALHALDLPEDTLVDAIAFSRGGLVLRSLLEQQIPKAPPKARFGKAIFVGCTNAGTMLAEPENWKSLVDLYTNLLVMGARIVTAATGTVPAQPFVTNAIKITGGFVQMLSQVAISERYVPGLAAMEPDGAFVLELNGAMAGSADLPDYFTIENAFEPGGDHSGPAFVALGRVATRLYQSSNDLVVHTPSMNDFGKFHHSVASHALVTPGIFHTIYFSAPEVLRTMGKWLFPDHMLAMAPPPQAAARVPREESFEPAAPRRNDYVDEGRINPPPRRGPASIDWGEPSAPPEEPVAASESMPAAPAPMPVGAEPPLANGASDASEGAREGDELVATGAPPTNEITERYISAEMLPYPLLARPANVYVTVSPDAITVADHGAAAATADPVLLDAKRALTVILIPLENCTLSGPESHQLSIAGPADEEVVKFAVKGIAAGPARLAVEARQGMHTVAAFTLSPVFVEAKPAPLRAQAIMAPPLPAAPGRAVLRIYEFKSGNGALNFQFNLTSDDPECAELDKTSLDGSVSLDAYADGVLRQIENAWSLRGQGDDTKIYDSFLERLTSDAKQRTEALIPPKIRKLLWKHRKQITGIQVISSEPSIPWELMYLTDPDGESRDDEGFLAEWGLTRWLHDAPLRRSRVSPENGDCRFVIPTYVDDRNQLKGAAQERTMLQTMFPHMEEIAAESSEVRRYLRDKAANCAILHFACHGRTKQDSVISSDLLMREQKNAEGEVIPDPLTWQDVWANADFGKGGGPLIFINACQTGRQGNGIAGAAGFANAFLSPQSRRGASAFIGALWSVDDNLAGRFSRAVYEGLQADKSLTEAVKDARKSCKNGNDFTWLAYSVFAG